MQSQVSFLASGLTVATASLPGFNSVAVGAYVKVGSRYERVDLNGISHGLEHMAFKGTKRRSAYQIALEIERVGGSINASTGPDRTGYYVKTLAEHTPLALDIIADVIQNSIFPVDELDVERGVILQEIARSRDNAEELVHEGFIRTAYPDQALGRPILGSPDIIERLTRDDLIAHMDQHYAANKIIVIGVGKVDHAAFYRMTEQAFDHLHTAITLPFEPAKYGGGHTWSAGPGGEQTHVQLGFPVCSWLDPLLPATDLLSDVLGGGMSSPLLQEIREKRGLVYEVMANSSHHVDAGMFLIYAGTSQEHVRELITKTCEQLKRVCSTISSDDFTRAKNQHRAYMLMKRERPFPLADEIVRDIMHKGRIIPIEETLAAYDAVTVEQIGAIAERMIAQPPTLSIVGPISDPSADYYDMLGVLRS